jgi:hypothetical protein
MNTFGLGLVITFDDQASEGIARVTQSYLGLESAVDSGSQLGNAMASQVGLNLAQVGDSFIGAGNRILNVFKMLSGNVKSTGQDFENFKITLGAIYKDESVVSKKIQQLFDFSMKSPFEVNDTKDMLVMMKSVGVDAFDTLTSASTGFAQEGLSWITDLMAFKPDVATTRWKLALTNFLGSGEGKVLQNILDSGKLTNILGHAISDTSEGRLQDLMEIAEKIGVQGLTEKMAGTMETRLSNVGDFLTKFYYKIGESGVFDQFKRMLGNMTSFITDDSIMTAENLDKFSSTVAEAFKVLLDPIEKLTEKFKALSVAVVSFVSEHPAILKIGMVFTTIAGAGLVLVGVMAKIGGIARSLTASLKFLTGGASIFGTIATSLFSILKFAAPLTAMAYILYKVWTLNVGGIQEKVQKLVQTLSLLWDGLDGNMSVEALRKARELGILPLIEAVLQLKYHLGFFFEGFKKGLDSFFVSFGKVLNSMGIFKDRITGFRDFITKLLEKITAPGMTDNWERLGEVAGRIAGKVMVFGTALWGIHKVLSKITGFTGGLSLLKNIPLIGGLFGGKGVSGSSGGGLLGGNFLSSPTKVLKSMTSLAIIIGGTTIVIEALGRLMSIQGFQMYLGQGLNVMSTLFENLIPIISDIVALGIALKLLDLINLSPSKALKGIADLAVILGGFVLIAEAVGYLTNDPAMAQLLSTGVKTLSETFDALDMFTSLNFYGAIATISALGYVSPAVVAKGVAGLGIVIGGIEAIVGLLGAVSQIPGYSEFMSSGGKALAQLGSIIGEAVGSLVSGLGVGLTNGLPDIANNLSEFAENIKPFFTTLGGISDISGVGDFLTSFAEFMVLLSANEVLSFFGGEANLPEAGTQLSQFAETAKTFFDTVASYSQEGIDKAEGVFNAIADMGNYTFRSGGLLQKITGEVHLDTAGEQLSAFATSAKTFFTTILTYPEGGLEKAPRVFDAIDKMGNSEFRFFGLWQDVIGNTRLDEVGRQLSSFGENAKSFFVAIVSYPEAGFEKAPKLFSCLSGIGDDAFKLGGLISVFKGDTSLDKIGGQLATFGQKSADFFKFAASVSNRGIENGEAIFGMLKIIGEGDFDSGGMWEWIAGSRDLENIGEQMTDFAEELVDFFDIVGEFSKSDINKGSLCIDMLKVIGEADIREGGLLGLIRGGFDLSDLGSNLGEFGKKAKTFFNAVKDIDEEAFPKGTKVINSLKALNDETFKSGGLIEWLAGGKVDLGNLATNLGSFGTNSKTFFLAVKNIDKNAMDNASEVFTCLGKMSQITDVVLSFGPNSLTNFGNDLVGLSESLTTFFNSASQMKTDNFNLTEVVKPFFDLITNFDASKFTTISNGVDNVGKSAQGLSNTLGKVASDVKTQASNIFTAIQNCTTQSIGALNSFSNQGSNVGYNLMVSIANGITANAYLITNAVQSAVNNVSVSIPSIASSAASQVYGPKKMVGLATGGYVSTAGIAMLHPNEVVVNDKITQGLRSFLDDYNKPNNTPVINQSIKRVGSLNNTEITVDDTRTVAVLTDILNVVSGKSKYDNLTPVLTGLIDSISSIGSNIPVINQSIVTPTTDERPQVVMADTPDYDFERPISSPVQNYVESTTVTNNTDMSRTDNTTSNSGSSDNRIIFESGSVVIQVEGSENGISEAELNKCADKLMQIMARKMQLKGMQTRR